MLTVEMLKAIPAHTIFAHGVVMDNEFGINMDNSGKDLRWIACTGGCGDWAIYCDWAYKSEEEIQYTGQKVGSERNIRHLIVCEDEAFLFYRY